MCKCPDDVVTGLFERNPNLRIINAALIVGEQIRIPVVDKTIKLTELRLKSVSSMAIENMPSLKQFTHLKHLSMTSIKGLDSVNYEVIGSLEALESLSKTVRTAIDDQMGKFINYIKKKSFCGFLNCYLHFFHQALNRIMSARS